MSILVKVLTAKALAPIISKMPKIRGTYLDFMISSPKENREIAKLIPVALFQTVQSEKNHHQSIKLLRLKRSQVIGVA
jgi:hypothetical protein